VQQLNSPRVLERLHALTRVAESADPKLTKPVLAALEDTDENVRLGALSALRSLPASKTVNRKLETAIMSEVSPRVRARIACELARAYPSSAASSLLSWTIREVRAGRNIQVALQFPSGPRLPAGVDQPEAAGCRIARTADEEAAIILGLLFQSTTKSNVPQLRGYLRDDSPQIRWLAAELITSTGPGLDAETIRSASSRGDLAVVAGAHKTLIREGKSESIPLLIAAFNKYPTPAMAAHYLSSGNPQLVDVAQQWASQRGFSDMELSTRASLKWGKDVLTDDAH
jgi:hypothetical protein